MKRIIAGRSAATVSAAVAVVALVALTGCASEEPVLYSQAAGIAGDGSLVEITANSSIEFEPGTRVLTGQDGPGSAAASAATAAAQRAWIETSVDLAEGTGYEDMAMWALADLDTLLLGDGALLAGASAKWDYVWPRDAAFGAAALAAAGHPNDAEAVLGFLQRVQGEDGGFEVATNRTDRLWRMGAGLNRTVRV